MPRETTSSSARWWWSVGGIQGVVSVGVRRLRGKGRDDGIAEDNRKWGKRRPYLGRQSSGVPDLKGRQEHSQHSKGSWGVKYVLVHMCFRDLSVTCWWKLKCSVFKCVCICVRSLHYCIFLQVGGKNGFEDTYSSQAVILRTHRYEHRRLHTAMNYQIIYRTESVCAFQFFVFFKILSPLQMIAHGM